MRTKIGITNEARVLDIVNRRLLGRGRNDALNVRGRWMFEIMRADGSVERKVLNNIVVAVGLDAIASRIGLDTTSRFGFLAIGTVTAQPSLGSSNFGEVSRKAGSTITSSKEVFIMVATWGGAADSLTGVALASGAVVNHVNSGQGTIMNIVNSVSTTLQDSDLLKVQMEIQIGSHNL